MSRGGGGPHIGAHTRPPLLSRPHTAPPPTPTLATPCTRSPVAAVCGFATPPPIPLVGLTIAAARDAVVVSGRASCLSLIRATADRAAALDAATGLNALRSLDRVAAERDAAAFDGELAAWRRQGGRRTSDPSTRWPLACAPLIIKDNIDVAGSATTGGSAALLANVRREDATAISRARAAGAIPLARGNMGEWGLSPLATASSAGGVTANVFDGRLSPAGSSGGVAAAVAAGFGVAGVATDTGNSVRGPAAFAGLVGVRPSLGVVPAGGVLPLDVDTDTVGPITHTLADAAALLDVLAGTDGSFVTAAAEGARPGAAARVRLGIVACALAGADASIRGVFEAALSSVAAAGATIMPNVTLTRTTLGEEGGWPCVAGVWPTRTGDAATLEPLQCIRTLPRDADAYLASAPSAVTLRTIQAIADAGVVHPSASRALARRLDAARRAATLGDAAAGSDGNATHPVCGCGAVTANPCRADLVAALVGALDGGGLDALVLPTWTQPPRPLTVNASADTTPDGNLGHLLAPAAGAPSIALPIGLDSRRLPVSLQLVGRPGRDAELLTTAAAVEAAVGAPPAIPPRFKDECGVCVRGRE